MTKIVNSNGGAPKTVAFVSGGGITVRHAADAVNPGIGSNAGDWLKIWWSIEDSATVVINDYRRS